MSREDVRVLHLQQFNGFRGRESSCRPRDTHMCSHIHGWKPRIDSYTVYHSSFTGQWITPLYIFSVPHGPFDESDIFQTSSQAAPLSRFGATSLGLLLKDNSLVTVAFGIAHLSLERSRHKATSQPNIQVPLETNHDDNESSQACGVAIHECGYRGDSNGGQRYLSSPSMLRSWNSWDSRS